MGLVAAGFVLTGGTELALVFLTLAAGRGPVDGGLVRLRTLGSVRFVVLVAALVLRHLSPIVSHTISPSGHQMLYMVILRPLGPRLKT
jgi:hypothetical protein